MAGPVVGVSMVRDEADVIGASVRRMAAQVDRLIVADNRSKDGTRDILEALAGELDLLVVDDPEPAYLQSAKMSALAARAGEEMGASWIVPFDADELWGCASEQRRIGDLLTEPTLVADDWCVVAADVFDMVATGLDLAEPDPVKRIRWRRRDPLPLPKVAARWRPGLVIEQGNHGATYPGIRPAVNPDRLLKVRHYAYRSAEQMARKARNGAQAYAAAGDRLPPDFGAHWRSWGCLTDDQIGDVFRKWFWRASPASPVVIDGEHQPGLVLDPVR